MSSLVVNTNMQAIQAYNDLSRTDNAMSTAISQLSSGLQIQTAADNPAGYVISEALSFQSTGYQAAMSNAQDSTAMIQTAVGALNQITSILQTMDQLAVASATSGRSGSAHWKSSSTARRTNPGQCWMRWRPSEDNAATYSRTRRTRSGYCATSVAATVRFRPTGDPVKNASRGASPSSRLPSVRMNGAVRGR